MSPLAVTIIVIAVLVVLALIAYAAYRRRRTTTLRDRFGPEYDRTLTDADNRRAGERDLADRAALRDELQIRDLAPAAASRYQSQWALVQQEFVDAPAAAVGQAQTLVTTVMRERGYPTEGEERDAVLSVDHADVMDRYRAATAIEDSSASGRATTEDMRQAMQHYRALFDRLLGDASASTADDAYPTDETTSSDSSRASTSLRR